MRITRTVLITALLGCISMAAVGQDGRKLLTLDEDVWVAFYDLPSRRFTNIRERFVQRDFAVARRDLDASAAFLRVEAERAVPELQPALFEVVSQMTALRDNLETRKVAAEDLDAVFARAHWLLSQQYLVLALQARDAGAHRNAGHYLWATAHHLERSVMWSNSRLDSNTVSSIDSLRSMAAALRDSESPQRVYRDRPIRLAARTMIAVGDNLKRNMRIRPLVETELQ